MDFVSIRVYPCPSVAEKLGCVSRLRSRGDQVR
jgi:hypothetical protein